MIINPGEFNKRIEFYERDGALDAAGYRSGSKLVYKFSAWASFRRESGKEIIANGGDYEKISVRFVIRTPKTKLSRHMQIKYAGEFYEIEYLNDYRDRGELTEILAQLVSLGG